MEGGGGAGVRFGEAARGSGAEVAGEASGRGREAKRRGKVGQERWRARLEVAHDALRDVRAQLPGGGGAGMRSEGSSKSPEECRSLCVEGQGGSTQKVKRRTFRKATGSSPKVAASLSSSPATLLHAGHQEAETETT